MSAGPERNPRSAPTGFWQSLAALATRIVDGGALSGERLRAIEDRLAALDGGNSSDGAKRAALYAVNVSRISAGRGPLNMRVNAQSEIEWTGAAVNKPAAQK